MDAMNELPDDLAKALKALDERAAKRARSVDPGRVSRTVLERLRVEPAPAERPMWVRHWRAMALAAAAVVVLAVLSVAVLRTQGARSGAAVAATALPLELDTQALAEGQAQALLQALEEVPAAGATYGEPSLGSVEELNEQELQTLLRDMEQLNGGGAL